MRANEDVANQLSEAHQEISGLLTQIEGLPVMDGQRKSFIGQLAVAVVRHFVALEECLYPHLKERAAEEDRPEEARMADDVIAEQGKVEEQLRLLEREAFGSCEFEGIVRTLTQQIRDHLREQESSLFSRGGAVRPGDGMPDPGARLRRIKQAVPIPPPRPEDQDATSVTNPLVFEPGTIDAVRDLTRKACWGD